ncbi:MAG TPA: hypothetical protein VGN88_08985, partial [Phycisphaerae bacterium]
PFRHDVANAKNAHYYPFEGWFLGGATATDPIYSMGLLYAPKGGGMANLSSGTISDPRIFFCPAQTDEGFSWVGGDKGANWLANTAGNATTGNPHMGYQYDLHVTVNPNSNGQYEVPYQELDAFPKNMSVLVDLINNTTDIAHQNSKGTGTWNMLFADGHVDPGTSSRMVTWLTTNSALITTEAGSTWTAFRPEMSDLERLSGN